jgi:membrane protease YdiL (CAAX protease family)
MVARGDLGVELPAEDVPKVRHNLYRGVIVTQWSLLALALVFWFGQRRDLVTLGFRFPLTWSFAAAIVMSVVAWFALLAQRKQLAGDPGGLARVRARLAHVERLLPRSVGERRWFDRVSITAGVCEEVLYRGFMLWYFEHWMGPIAALFRLQRYSAGATSTGARHGHHGCRGCCSAAYTSRRDR